MPKMEYDYKIRETDAGEWEVYEGRTGELLEIFPDPVTAGEWARNRLIAKAERQRNDNNPSGSL